MIKSYQEFVNEGVKYIPSYDEAKADIETVREAMTKAEKQSIADKYGINSVKIAEIVDGIHHIMNDAHKTKSPSQYTDDDFKSWWACFDGPTSSVALKKALAGESIEWCQFVLGRANELIFAGKRGDYWARAKNSFEKYINGLLNKDKNDKDVGLQALLKTLFAETKDFHDAYIDAVNRWAEEYFGMYSQFKDFNIYDFMCFFGVMNREVLANIYDRENNFRKGMMAIYRQTKGNTGDYFYPTSEEYTPKVSTIKYFSTTVSAIPVRKKLATDYRLEEVDAHTPANYADVPSKEATRYYANTVVMKTKYKWNKKSFIDDKIDEAEKKFKYDIEAIAEKVRRMNMDEENLKLQSIDSDAKHFDVVLTDGKKSCHARSIFAAEFSEKVTPHYRFIIT